MILDVFIFRWWIKEVLNISYLAGVFLIPYVIIMVICGVPMLYMEIAVGQFTGRGPIGALGHLCPLLKGK